MFCPKCGKQLPDSSKFCTGCGAQLIQTDQSKQTKKPKQAKEPKQAKAVRLPEPVKNEAAGMPSAGLSSQIGMSAKTKETENRNRRTMIILFVTLIVLIVIAVGMAIYYVKELHDSDNKGDVESEIVNGDDEEAQDPETMQEPQEQVDEAGAADPEQGTEETYAEETAPVVSDTNEVVKNTILAGVPKALYSYNFDETLGNAQVVVRDTPPEMPEVSSDVEAQYVPGMDGSAVYLDGSYGIQLSDVKKIGTSYSIAFWMKADALYDWAPFIHIGYDLLSTDYKCRLWLGQKTDGTSVAPILSSEQAVLSDSFEIRPEANAVSSMNAGVWYHIVFTVDGDTKGSRESSVFGTLYVSGRYAGSGDIVLNTMNVDDFTVYLGINCWDVLYPVAFDDVKIWDKVLTGQQVSQLFNAYQ